MGFGTILISTEKDRSVFNSIVIPFLRDTLFLPPNYDLS